MTIQAELSYLARSSERPYFYLNGTPSGERQTNVRGDRREMEIHDARALSPAPRLEREGVELVRWGEAPENEHDEKAVCQTFFPLVEDLVRDRTGAARVRAFDYNLRSSDKEHTRGTIVQPPVWLVHNDYTEQSGPQRVRDLLGDEAEDLLQLRFAVINVWKPIHAAVERAPLAVCDARTIDAEHMIETDLRYPDRTGEIYSFTFSAGHRWLYFPDMQINETMLIKCFDSARDRARFTAHTAVTDSNTAENAPARRSIEIRTLAFFDAPG